MLWVSEWVSSFLTAHQHNICSSRVSCLLIYKLLPVTLIAESAESTESAPIQHTNYWIGRVRPSRSTAEGGAGTFPALIRVNCQLLGPSSSAGRQETTGHWTPAQLAVIIDPSSAPSSFSVTVCNCSNAADAVISGMNPRRFSRFSN